MSSIKVFKSTFTRAHCDGDFGWMIRQPEYTRTLFLFNDNEGEFLAHHSGGPHTCDPGGGNAAIRPYQCQTPQRALGIPTGTYSAGVHYLGYSCLDAHVVSILDLAFARLDERLSTGHYDSVAFSWDEETKLGGRIFNTAQSVRNLVVERIFAAASRH